MVEVILYTAEGEVAATVLVPRFVVPVEVINWGMRTFVRLREDGRYFEAMTYRVPPDASS